MRKLSLLIIAILVGLPVISAAESAILPQPARWVAGEGEFIVPSQIIVAPKSKNSAGMAKLTAEYLKDSGFDVSRGTLGNASVTVELCDTMKHEQYRMSVTSSSVNIAAADKSGFYYAVQSLSQLLSSSDGTIAACEIDDYPRFGYRGLMIDVVRCYIEPDEIKRIIDIAGKLKINNVHLHLTDNNGWRLQIKKYPKLVEVGAWRVDRPELFPGRLNARSADEPATVGGFYTAEQMKDIVRYAADRNINVIPEIEMPAHSAAAIASYPELACPSVDKYVGVFPGIGGYDASIILCAGNEKVYRFITDVLDEVMEIFPSKYIHLGGDEANKAYWHKCPLCTKKIEDESLGGYEELQGYMMDRISNYVKSHGREVMGWDEVTYGNPKEDMIIYGWQGDGGVAVRYAAKTGRRFILTPAKVMYLIRYQGPQWFEPWTYFGNNTLKNVYDYEPVDTSWTAGMENQLLGVQGSLWSEFCKSPSDVQYLIFPRLMAVADVAWSQKGDKDWKRFLGALDNFLPQLDKAGVNYARSMYNLDHKVTATAPGELDVNVSCIRPDVTVRYSFNDSTFGSAADFTGPISVNSPSILYLATFSGDKRMGRTLALDLSFNKATGCIVKSANCRNGLANVLTNGLRGSDRNSDFEWAGWWNETAEFVVDLGEKKPVSKVSLGTLVHSDICVVAPKHIYVYTSDNGSTYALQASVELDDDLIYNKQAKIVDIDCGKFDTEARYLKFVAINPGRIPDGMAREGTATWMYFDEISIQ